MDVGFLLLVPLIVIFIGLPIVIWKRGLHRTAVLVVVIELLYVIAVVLTSINQIWSMHY